ncbi:MAG: DUF547 domain-containing protein, partial [Myxococcota bacterium]
LLAGTGSSALAESARDEPAWVSLWGEMLSRHTRAVEAEVGTRVDYSALSQDPSWPQTVAALSRFDPAGLHTREEKLAFWINAYNILAIDIVLQSYPVKSIRDIGWWFRPVFKRPAGEIYGRSYSLDEIEHEILRPMGEPRIHGALVCASVSCPNLLREPYRAEGLYNQFDASLRAWMRRPEKGLWLDRERGVLRVSRVFDWFREDFGAGGGVLPFVTRYAPLRDAAWIRANPGPVSLEYFPFDWNLND